ncbi:MAG: FAD-binding oxidoreductase [Pseudomonadota bacterium]
MIIEKLRDSLPGLRATVDPGDLQEYGRDWTRFVPPAPAAIVFPESTEAVQALVSWAREHEFALVPSGGRTGLSGGAVAPAGEIVVSMERMNALGDWNPVDRLLTCGAGAVTQRIQDFAVEQGLYYPVSFASEGSSQIGGNVATNAGGIKVLRYGLTRDRVAGLQVVTGAGEVLDLNRGLVKNATGYDLRHLFIGSEGTLGIITQVTLELVDAPPAQAVMVVGAADMQAIMGIFGAARASLTLSAYEFFSDRALGRVLAHHELRGPFETRCPYYALLEFDCAGDDDEATAAEVFERCMEAGWVLDGVISQSESQAQDLWKLREYISESIAPATPYKNDLSVRVSRVPGFLETLDALVGERYPDFEVVWFGHIGDGNLHLNILKPDGLETGEFQARCEAVNDEVFELVARHDGSVSAENGVGMLKKPYLGHSRDQAEIEAMRAVKGVFDPDGILNPGKLIDR